MLCTHYNVSICICQAFFALPCLHLYIFPLYLFFREKVYLDEQEKCYGAAHSRTPKGRWFNSGAVRNYENGLREPNSKAMAALERFFKVSGEYLRGDIDRETFLQNSATIQDRLDGLVGLFQTFKLDFDCSSQERQMLAVSILSGVMETVTTQLLRDDGPADLDGDQFAQIFQAAFALNPQGRTELAKRAAELTQLEQYKR